MWLMAMSGGVRKANLKEYYFPEEFFDKTDLGLKASGCLRFR
jgi:hypothetical protein